METDFVNEIVPHISAILPEYASIGESLLSIITENLPELGGKDDHNDTPRVQIFWNLFPFNWYFDPI